MSSTVPSSTAGTPVPPGAASPADPGRWFREEVRPHESALKGYLSRHFPTLEADEVVQESYLRLFKARAEGRVASAKSYIFAIARNTALTLFRRRRLYSPTPLEELPDTLVSEEGRDVVNENLQFDLAVLAIGSLPPKCRQIMRLAVLERRSAREIAQELGLQENTVYNQISIGIQKCSAYVREREGRS